MNDSIPKLWEKELERSLKTHFPWPMDFTPRKLTLRQRLRLLWWRVLNWWPLEWKDRNSE